MDLAFLSFDKFQAALSLDFDRSFVGAGYFASVLSSLGSSTVHLSLFETTHQMLKDASAGCWSFAGVPHSRDTLGSRQITVVRSRLG